MKECAACNKVVKVVMVPDSVGKGLHETYECPEHGEVTETQNVRAKCKVKVELEIEVEYDTEEHDPEYVSDSLSITVVPQDEEDGLTICSVNCVKSEPAEEVNV